MSEVWSLPGYDVQALLGSGAAGEVWRARELATGDTVALKRLRADVDLAAVGALRREAALLRSLDTPYVVRLREVVGSGADTVVVLDHAPGGSLAALLARRGWLDAGEVVTIATPLAQALAAAHGRGLVHGDITPANVLFTAEGMPLLSDLGLGRMSGERLASAGGTAEYADPAVVRGGPPDAAADVWALAAVCHRMLAACAAGGRAPLGLLAPSAPRDLVAVIEAALVADPALRTDAAGFASQLRRAHAAAPVRLVAERTAAGPVLSVRATTAAPAVAHGDPVAPRPRVPHGVLLGLGLAALLVVGAVAGWASGRAGEQVGPALPPAVAPAVTPSASPPASPSVSADWAPVLDGLDAARAEAFAIGDVAGLGRVYASDSPGLASDAALLQTLVDQRQTAHGLRHEVRSVEVHSASASSQLLRVVDVLRAYEVRDAAGAVVSRAPARDQQAFLVELSRSSGGWRLVQVRPAAP